MLFAVRNLFADENINNLYKRDIYSGKYQLSSESYISYKIRYDVEKYEEKTFIKGYYFDSEKTKFIDTYLNDKLVKTEYYSKSGKKVFERIYAYNENERIIFIETNAGNENSKFEFSCKTFFEYCKEDIKVNQIVKYSMLKNNNLSNYICIENLVLNQRYKPQMCDNKIIIFSEKESKLLNVLEKWKNKKNGFNYICTINNEIKCHYSQSQKKGLEIKKTFFENKKNIFEEYLKISDNKICETKSYKENIQEYTGISNYYNESYKDYYYDDIRYIFLEDEKIILNDEQVTTDNLCIPLDIFGFRYFKMDFTLYE